MTKQPPQDQPEENTVTDISNHIKLPTIFLTSFSGAYDEWMLFHDTFESLIDKNEVAFINSII